MKKVLGILLNMSKVTGRRGESSGWEVFIGSTNVLIMMMIVLFRGFSGWLDGW